LSDQNASTMKSVQGELQQQVESQQDREIERQKVLHEQLQGFQGNQEKLTENIEGVLDAQKQQNAELTSSLGGVIERFEKLAVSHENATVAMQTVSTDLNATSNQLGILSTNLRSASENFAGELAKAVENANDITERNAGVVGLVEKLLTDLDTTRERISETAEIMGVAAEKAGAGLSAVEGHFDTLSKSLGDSVESLGNQVAELLKDYSEQVQSQTVARLNTWNEQTNTYIGSMTDAVRALNDVVDEIDGKIRGPQNGADS
jgi:ABC-type transporter Mla subunit MlaD